MLRYSSAVFAILMFGFFSFTAPPVQAQPLCFERMEGVTELQRMFSEEPSAMGLGVNGEVIEVFTSKSGTFTIISTRPDGTSCVVLSGDVWENLPVRTAGIES